MNVGVRNMRKGLTALVSSGAMLLGGCEILNQDPPAALFYGGAKALAIQRGNAGMAAAIDTGALLTGAQKGKSDVRQEVYVNSPQVNQQNQTEVIQTPDYFGPFFICSKWTDKNNDDKPDYPEEFDVKNYFNSNSDAQMIFYAVTRLNRPYNISFELINLEDDSLLARGGRNGYPKENDKATWNEIAIKREIMPEEIIRFKMRCLIDGQICGERTGTFDRSRRIEIIIERPMR